MIIGYRFRFQQLGQLLLQRKYTEEVAQWIIVTDVIPVEVILNADVEFREVFRVRFGQIDVRQSLPIEKIQKFPIEARPTVQNVGQIVSRVREHVKNLLFVLGGERFHFLNDALAGVKRRIFAQRF